jgi:hypothetical protein
MTRIRLFPILMILAVSLAACAPAGSTAPPGQPAALSTPTSLPALDPSTPAAGEPTDSPVPSPLPLATSRGPELHASDPSTVSLASGGLQLVEFFRFT